MRIISVVGFKKSGKTTLVGLLAEALEKQGASTGVVKYTHHDLDLPETDTATLLRPGRPVAGCAPAHTVFFEAGELPFESIVARFNVDVLLVEGGKTRVRGPRILCLREPEEAPTLAGDNRISACVGAEPPDGFPPVPHFAEINEATAAALADLILAPLADAPHKGSCSSCPEHLNRRPCRSDCPKKHGGVALSVDGRPVNLNAFVERLVEGTVRGLLEQLDGCDGGDLVLSLKKGGRNHPN